MKAALVHLDERRPDPLPEAQLWQRATALLQHAQMHPSMNNMKAAVDAWRAWERVAFEEET